VIFVILAFRSIFLVKRATAKVIWHDGSTNRRWGIGADPQKRGIPPPLELSGHDPAVRKDVGEAIVEIVRTVS
jgi:hypothetical protein